MRVVVAPVAELPPGERLIIDVERRSIGVFRIEDEFYAVRNRCPHQGGPLCLGRVSRRVVSDRPGQVRYGDEPPFISCPWHGWEYDLATGQSFVGRSEPHVRAYEVTVERVPGPYVAETYPVGIEEEYVVLEV